METFLKANEVYSLLRISRSTVFNLWSQGELSAMRFGRSIQCRLCDLTFFTNFRITAKPKNLPAVDAASKSIPVTPLGKGDHL